MCTQEHPLAILTLSIFYFNKGLGYKIEQRLGKNQCGIWPLYEEVEKEGAVVGQGKGKRNVWEVGGLGN